MGDDLLDTGTGAADADASRRHALHQLDRDGSFVEVRGRKGHEHVLDVRQDFLQPRSFEDPEILNIRSLQEAVLRGFGTRDPEVDREVMRLRVFRETFEEIEPGPRLETPHVEAARPVPAAVSRCDRHRYRAIPQDRDAVPLETAIGERGSHIVGHGKDVVGLARDERLDPAKGPGEGGLVTPAHETGAVFGDQIVEIHDESVAADPGDEETEEAGVGARRVRDDYVRLEPTGEAEGPE